MIGKCERWPSSLSDPLNDDRSRPPCAASSVLPAAATAAAISGRSSSRASNRPRTTHTPVAKRCGAASTAANVRSTPGYTIRIDK